MIRINIADVVKKQTDRILRQQRQNGTASKTITGNPAGDPVVTDPNVNLTAHKTSGDHDSRYYTESEVDSLVGAKPDTFLELTDTPAAYTGQQGKVLAVNSTEDALEFITPSSGTSGAFDFGLITEAASYSWDWGSLS